MKQLPLNKPSEKIRAYRMCWGAEDTRVRHLMCYECPPNEAVWWCPDAGFSGQQEYHFFETKELAVSKVRQDLINDIAALQKALSEL